MEGEKHMTNKAGLARDVQFPEVDTFGELFESFTTDKANAPADITLSREPETGRVGSLSAYIRMPKYKAGYTRLRREFQDALTANMLTHLTLSFAAISHADVGRTLILAEYSEIIGSHWLAYVRTDSLPAA